LRGLRKSELDEHFTPSLLKREGSRSPPRPPLLNRDTLSSDEGREDINPFMFFPPFFYTRASRARRPQVVNPPNPPEGGSYLPLLIRFEVEAGGSF